MNQATNEDDIEIADPMAEIADSYSLAILLMMDFRDLSTEILKTGLPGLSDRQRELFFKVNARFLDWEEEALCADAHSEIQSKYPGTDLDSILGMEAGVLSWVRSEKGVKAKDRISNAIRLLKEYNDRIAQRLVD